MQQHINPNGRMPLPGHIEGGIADALASLRQRRAGGAGIDPLDRRAFFTNVHTLGKFYLFPEELERAVRAEKKPLLWNLCTILKVRLDAAVEHKLGKARYPKHYLENVHEVLGELEAEFVLPEQLAKLAALFKKLYLAELSSNDFSRIEPLAPDEAARYSEEYASCRKGLVGSF